MTGSTFRMPLGYRLSKYIKSTLGRFRTGDRVLVTGGDYRTWLGDPYTGTVEHAVYGVVNVRPDIPHVFLSRVDESASKLVRIAPEFPSQSLDRQD